jgi:phenylacetic acid degradation operon negative regulatory protein
MRMALFMADLLGEIPWRVLDSAWDAWTGEQRRERKLARLQELGVVAVDAAADHLERVVRLTDAGRSAALGGIDFEARWRRAWDGRWRIVLFDVAEKDRSRRIRLQRQLRRARFGYLQDSVWISPDPIDDIAAAVRSVGQGLATLSFLEARPCVGSSDAVLVAGAWDFTLINHRYAEHAEFLRTAPGPKVTARQRGEWLRRECQAWQHAIDVDPLLPEVLLPAGYRGRKAWDARREALIKLLRPA